MTFDIRENLRVDVDQMYGVEIEEWPARIAEVAMWLMDHQMNLEVSRAFGHYVARLPLDRSARIVQGNALRIPWTEVVGRDQCSYVLGNPPFVGKKARTREQANDMERTFGGRGGVGNLDYVCCWYQVAAHFISNRTRVAFVSTNSISQGEQPAILWPSLFRHFGIHIHFAHRTFPWESEARGKAHVHVVIVGFGRENPRNKEIHDYDKLGRHLGVESVSNISPYLVAGSDIAVSARRLPISDVPEMRFGSMPNDGGFLVMDNDEREELLSEGSEAEEYIRPLISARQYLEGEQRWCVWLEDTSPSRIRRLPGIAQRVENVRNYRLQSKRSATKALAGRPALFGEIRQPRSSYVLIPRHSSDRRDYIPMSFFGPDVIVSDSCLFVADATYYHFGIMQSKMHMAWVRHIGGRIKSDFRYSARLVYNNFPWPKSPTSKQITEVEKAAAQVLSVRSTYPESSLADLYDPISMPSKLRSAHDLLDRRVDRCYRRQAFPDERRRFEYLLAYWEKLSSPLQARRRA